MTPYRHQTSLYNSALWEICGSQANRFKKHVGRNTSNNAFSSVIKTEIVDLCKQPVLKTSWSFSVYRRNFGRRHGDMVVSRFLVSRVRAVQHYTGSHHAVPSIRFQRWNLPRDCQHSLPKGIKFSTLLHLQKVIIFLRQDNSSCCIVPSAVLAYVSALNGVQWEQNACRIWI